MSFTIDNDLQEGLRLIQGGEVTAGFKLINQSARKGTTKGKSYFEIGRILREGVKGMPADAKTARKYYDIAMKHFKKNAKDSMDFREMGDYYYYGLGRKPIDKKLALEYYRKALELGDDSVQSKLDEIFYW